MAAKHLRWWIAAALIVILSAGVAGWLVRQRAAPPRLTRHVLFVGNSFTFANSMPAMLESLARSRGDRLTWHDVSVGGYTLAQHASNAATLAAIRAGGWDDVVVQEQSEIPAMPDDQVARTMDPGLRALVGAIRQAAPGTNPRGTSIVLFETWGYRDGDADLCPQAPTVCSYSAMQDQLSRSYARLSALAGAGVAGVGQAWRRIRDEHPEIDLYAADGRHPSTAGSYLAACVLYRALFGRSAGGADSLGLPGDVARTLQRAA